MYNGALPCEKGDIFRISSMEDIGMEDGIYKVKDIIYSKDTKYNEHKIIWEGLGIFRKGDMQKEEKPKFKIGDKVKYEDKIGTIIDIEVLSKDVGVCEYVNVEVYKIQFEGYIDWVEFNEGIELIIQPKFNFIMRPVQKKRNESDFGILMSDGSLIKAFWRGEDENTSA